MIGHKHKFIFVHVGRTGGSSMEHILNPTVNLDKNERAKNTGNTAFKGKHMFAAKYKAKHRKEFDTYFKFAFVRNPWDREVSSFKWFELVLDRGITFPEHIKRRNSVGEGKRLGPMNKMGFSRWLCDINGKNLLDFIGRFENLQHDFNIVCDKIGIPRQQLPHTNKTNRKHYTEYYDDETRGLVAEKYKKDIETFGYEFE
jgi:hypothetical protein